MPLNQHVPGNHHYYKIYLEFLSTCWYHTLTVCMRVYILYLYMSIYRELDC